MADEDEFSYGEETSHDEEYFPEEDTDFEQVQKEAQKHKQDVALNTVDLKKVFLPDPKEVSACSLLNDVQTAALHYVAEHSRKLSNDAIPALRAKIVGLGFTEDDCDTALRYLRDTAPVIIHVFADILTEFLAKDTHYRNQFETNTSKGSLSHTDRCTWENAMFAGIYKDDMPGTDRVKYGSLNVLADPAGAVGSAQYGDCHMVMKGVRLRTTFANGDTGSPQFQDGLAMCEYYAHVLRDFSDVELQHVMEVALQKVPFHSSSFINQYKEVQIHGPIVLAHHVDKLIIPDTFSKDQFGEFQAAHSVEILTVSEFTALKQELFEAAKAEEAKAQAAE
eukprot:TRINITY_DN1554_c0_g1_i2.p2 TRINITY_DN1554_c0_g1~~TRINITY_DN1554_c0_g1_i2.p2  ORF type:complete len:336 (+),score=64.13 TRINITY_DN1554_c0_g1_i2:108-1115(+)